jgi:hypothetical protein
MRAFYIGQLFLASIISTLAQAQSGNINMVSSAMPFLQISPDARAGGMGNTGIATPSDANAPFWNTSKIPFSKTASGIGANYVPWLSDVTSGVYLATLSGYHKLDDQQALSASMRYFNMGDVQFSDNSGNKLNSYQPREFSFDLGYSRKLSDRFAMGITLRYINSRLASGDANNSGISYKPASAVAGDISFYYNGLNDAGSGWTAGAVVSNLGSKVSYSSDTQNKDYLPANLGLGVAHTSILDDDMTRITIGLDVNKLLVPGIPADSAGMADYYQYGIVQSWFKSFGSGGAGIKSWQASFGMEAAFYEQIFFRGGYCYQGQAAGDQKYFTLGLGVKYSGTGVNLSYNIPSGNGITRNPLSNTLRVGLTFDFQ